jgi:hypothetical protein
LRSCASGLCRYWQIVPRRGRAARMVIRRAARRSQGHANDGMAALPKSSVGRLTNCIQEFGDRA